MRACYTFDRRYTKFDRLAHKKGAMMTQSNDFTGCVKMLTVCACQDMIITFAAWHRTPFNMAMEKRKKTSLRFYCINHLIIDQNGETVSFNVKASQGKRRERKRAKGKKRREKKRQKRKRRKKKKSPGKKVAWKSHIKKSLEKKLYEKDRRKRAECKSQIAHEKCSNRIPIPQPKVNRNVRNVGENIWFRFCHFIRIIWVNFVVLF